MRRGLIIVPVLILCLTACTASVAPKSSNCGTLPKSASAAFTQLVDPSFLTTPVTSRAPKGKVVYVAAHLSDNSAPVWALVDGTSGAISTDSFVSLNDAAKAHSTAKDGTVAPYGLSETDPGAVAALKCLSDASGLPTDGS